eukprot:1870396-Prymnesium_polylepis.1
MCAPRTRARPCAATGARSAPGFGTRVGVVSVAVKAKIAEQPVRRLDDLLVFLRLLLSACARARGARGA